MLEAQAIIEQICGRACITLRILDDMWQAKLGAREEIYVI